MLSVSESVDLHMPVADIWKTVGDFSAIDRYLAAVDRCVMNGDAENCERVLLLRDGGAVRERLILSSPTDHAMRYAIVESTLPVDDYTATLRVDELDAQQCRVTWSSSFDARNVPDVEAKGIIAAIYRQGFDGLRRLHRLG